MDCPFCGSVCDRKSAYCAYCGWQFVNPVVRKVPSRKRLRAFIAGLLALAALAAVVILLPHTRAPRQVQTVSAPASQKGDVGERLDVGSGNSWPCYLAAEASQDLTKWILLGDKAQVSKTLRDAHWITLQPGEHIEIIDADPGRRKVRVLGTGQECWVEMAALKPGSNLP